MLQYMQRLFRHKRNNSYVLQDKGDAGECAGDCNANAHEGVKVELDDAGGGVGSSRGRLLGIGKAAAGARGGRRR